MILVDTSVVLDLVLDDPIWGAWSEAQLDAAGDQQFAINDIVYAEASIGYPSMGEIDAMLRTWRLELTPMPRGALFEAGKAVALIAP